MFQAMPLGTNRSSRARAGLAALVLHLTVVTAAVHGTGGTMPAATRAPVDTIRIELPRARSAERTSKQVPVRSELPVMPSAPLVPPPLDQRQSPPLQPDVSSLGQVLSTLRASALAGAEIPGSASGDTLPVAAGDVDRLPELLGDLAPRYPDELQAAGLTGETVVEYVIGPEGRVVRSTIRVVQTTHPALARSVIEALTSARFRPGRRAGQVVAVLVRQRIRFERREASRSDFRR
jgi:periplasmic protein TonB